MAPWDADDGEAIQGVAVPVLGLAKPGQFARRSRVRRRARRGVTATASRPR